MNPTPILKNIRTALDNVPDANILRSIRATLDEPAFFTELNEYLRGVNDPTIKADILSDIIAISRHCSDKGEKGRTT
jgi:hypothetical protein